MSRLVIGVVIMLAIAAAPASAASVGLTDSGATLTYVAGPGEINDLTVTLASGSYTVTDPGVATLTDSGGCTVAGNQATCPEAGVTTIRIDPGDGDDRVAIGAPTPALVLARGGGLDTITCEPGDTVAADAGDPVTGCQADLPPETNISSGPSGRTSQNPPVFGSDSPDPDVAGFECRFDAAPFGPCTAASLAEGPHGFEVRAFDGFGPDPTPARRDFELDTTAPETAIDSGPPSETESSTATFSFLSPSQDAVAFQCRLDRLDWQPCTSPATYEGLRRGAHHFSVRTVDDVGNADPTGARVDFTVVAGVGSSALPPGLIVTRPAASFVLIAGQTIKVSRKRVATVVLNCSGNRDCAGELTLVTAKRIKLSRKRRRFVRLGAASFFIPAPRTLTIRIPLTKRAFRIVRKRKRLKTMVTVTDRDRVGRTRISTREVFLKAR